MRHGQPRTRRRAFRVTGLVLLMVVALLPGVGAAGAVTGNPATWTTDADFAEGTLVNVNTDDVADQLQLDSESTPFNFIWVAVSSEGTVVKIDTTTGAVLGEYRTTPSSQGWGNPSRTTVDNDGSVWVANRQDVSSGYGTVLHIGLEENGQCEDRNLNGTIETSNGLADVLAWADASGLRGVATAADECIVHYTQVNSRGTRHASVDANNDVWVGGLTLRNFDLVTGGRYDAPGSGTIARSETSVGFGGYGGLIDGNGVIWSARNLLRWDTTNPLSGPSGLNWDGYLHDSYGLCIDNSGNVWNTALSGNAIRKFAPNGALLGTFVHGSHYAQGCVVDGNDHVWVAHSLLGSSNTVGHLLGNGTYIGNVVVGSGPTGVAVDAAGKVWATNYYGRTVSRIDPALGPVGADGVTTVGAVDFTTVDLGGLLYNYSDMTGSTLFAPPDTGTWTVEHDSGLVAAPWSDVSWTSQEPSDGTVTVEVAVSPDGVTFGPLTPVVNAGDPGLSGQYLRVVVTFQRATSGETPVLEDLTVTHNRPPVADANGPYVVDEGSTLTLDASGSTDPDLPDDTLMYAWDLDNDGSHDDAFGVMPTAGPFPDGPNLLPIGLEVTDSFGAIDTTTTTVTVTNVAPTVGAVSVPEEPVAVGTPVPASAPFTDPAADNDMPYTCEVDFGEAIEAGADTGYVCSASHTYAEAGIYTVVVTVTDKDGGAGSAAATTLVVVYDPDAGFVTGGGWFNSPEGAYQPVGLPFDGSFYELVSPPLSWPDAEAAAAAMSTDACQGAHLATFTSAGEQEVLTALMEESDGNAWIGGYQPPGALVEDEGWLWVTAEPWAYTNWAGGEPNDTPFGTYVAGSEQHLEALAGDGAWNDAPDFEEKYYVVEYEECDMGPTGKATFGFVSKYKKGASAPTGNTQFQFHAAGLNFHSTSYDWLVVTGSNYARYKGVGTINGEGAYKFMIWAGDDEPDTFRIKIWTETGGVETVVYDNAMDQPINGGSIVIHTKKK